MHHPEDLVATARAPGFRVERVGLEAKPMLPASSPTRRGILRRRGAGVAYLAIGGARAICRQRLPSSGLVLTGLNCAGALHRHP